MELRDLRQARDLFNPFRDQPAPVQVAVAFVALVLLALAVLEAHPLAEPRDDDLDLLPRLRVVQASIERDHAPPPVTRLAPPTTAATTPVGQGGARVGWRDAPALPERAVAGVRHDDLRRDVGAGGRHRRREPGPGLPRR